MKLLSLQKQAKSLVWQPVEPIAEGGTLLGERQKWYQLGLLLVRMAWGEWRAELVGLWRGQGGKEW